jgi:hypothetical protein
VNGLTDGEVYFVRVEDSDLNLFSIFATVEDARDGSQAIKVSGGSPSSMFQCNDWGGGENDKLELEIVRERCTLAGSIAYFGWRLRAQSFKPMAVELHNKVDALSKLELLAYVNDIEDSTEDVHDYVMKEQTRLILSLWHSSGKVPIVRKELFHPKREILTMLDGLEMLMEERLSTTKLSITDGSVKEALMHLLDDRLSLAFRGKMFDGAGDPIARDKLITSRTLAVASLDQAMQDAVANADKLAAAGLHGLKDRVNTYILMEVNGENVWRNQRGRRSTKEEVRKLLGIKNEATEQASSAPDQADDSGPALKRATTKLVGSDKPCEVVLRRAEEIEIEPLADIENWQVNSTDLLSFFRVVSLKEFRAIVGDGPAGIASVSRFENSRDKILEGAKDKLNEQLEELISFGEFEVDPNNPDSDVYQEYTRRLSKVEDEKGKSNSDELKFDVMNETEAANLDKLKEYDEMIEAFHIYVDHVSEQFNFSADMQELCNSALNTVKDHSFQLKSSVLDFWSAEKKRVAEAAKDQEKKANEATKIAKMEKEMAMSAQEKLERRQAALEQMNQKLQARIDEALEHNKEAAREAKEMKKKAEIAQQSAENARAEAVEAAQVAEAVRVSANEARIKAEKAQIALEEKEAELQKKDAETDHFFAQLTDAFDPTTISSLWNKAQQLTQPPKDTPRKLTRSNST